LRIRLQSLRDSRFLTTWYGALVDTAQAVALFDELYAGSNAHAVAVSYVRSQTRPSFGLTYGEIVPASFDAFLRHANPRKGEVFYDLGSGSGKAVIYAALAFDFSKAIGIELVPGLNELARQVLERCEVEAKRRGHVLPELQLITGTFETTDLSDAGLIFCHATCIGTELDRMKSQLEATRPGTRLALVGYRMSSPVFKLLAKTTCELNWGTSNAYIYERTETSLDLPRSGS
jgi:SAM-dependent methyltransferase